MLSNEIFISTSDTHSILNESEERINPEQSVIIEANVWIGRGVKILKGTTIREGCIIAAGSIVTKPTERNCIYAGNPAVKIRENITWKRERL